MSLRVVETKRKASQVECYLGNCFWKCLTLHEINLDNYFLPSMKLGNRESGHKGHNIRVCSIISENFEGFDI